MKIKDSSYFFIFFRR